MVSAGFVGCAVHRRVVANVCFGFVHIGHRRRGIGIRQIRRRRLDGQPRARWRSLRRRSRPASSHPMRTLPPRRSPRPLPRLRLPRRPLSRLPGDRVWRQRRRVQPRATAAGSRRRSAGSRRWHCSWLAPLVYVARLCSGSLSWFGHRVCHEADTERGPTDRLRRRSTYRGLRGFLVPPASDLGGPT